MAEKTEEECDRYSEQMRRRFDLQYRLLIWAIGIFVSIGGLVQGWTVNTVWKAHEAMTEINIRVAKIEANRFTSHDATQVFKQVADIQKELARIPREGPPPWFKEKVEQNTQRITQLEHKVWKGKPAN